MASFEQAGRRGAGEGRGGQGLSRGQGSSGRPGRSGGQGGEDWHLSVLANGIVVLDKPTGPTSHDIVERCRRLFHQKKVGHAGTLDPGATGVLLVGLGQATRLLKYLSGLPKRYQGEVVLGVATTTLDAAGAVTGTWDMSSVTLEAARGAAAQLTGEIPQVPPMVSALKVGGRRLHELARQGIEVERQPRVVTVTRFDVVLAGTGEHGPVLGVDVECSSGTYVRALAADLGRLLGGGAHLRNLRRLAVGTYTVDEAVTLEELERAPADERCRFVLPPAEALRGVPRVDVQGQLALAVSHGRPLRVSELVGEGGGAQRWAVFGEAGKLLAVYEAYGDGMAKPGVVLGPMA